MEAFRSRWQRTPSKFDFGLDLILDGLENTGATIRSPTPSSQPNDKRSQPEPPNG